MDTYQEIQENLFEYFEEIDDKTLISFITSFVYNNGTSDSSTSKLIEKFLEENGLVDTFCKYQMDLNEPKSFFRRCSMSQASMIDQIKQGLLSVAFNRFKQYLK